MIPSFIESKIARLRTLGWKCIWANKKREIPSHILKRYENIPSEYIEFVESLTECTNQTNTRWFLSVEDFSGISESAFTWDEWERMSLEAAGEDPKIIRSILKFWNAHLPIHFDVSDGYAFHAIRLSDGAIVTGREPEFEEIDVVAGSLQDFIASIQ